MKYPSTQSPKKARHKVQKKKKVVYRVKNWNEYNESLVRRGSLDFWVEQGIIKKWNVRVVRHIPKKRGKPISNG